MRSLASVLVIAVLYAYRFRHSRCVAIHSRPRGLRTNSMGCRASSQCRHSARYQMMTAVIIRLSATVVVGILRLLAQGRLREWHLLFIQGNQATERF